MRWESVGNVFVNEGYEPGCGWGSYPFGGQRFPNPFNPFVDTVGHDLPGNAQRLGNLLMRLIFKEAEYNWVAKIRREFRDGPIHMFSKITPGGIDGFHVFRAVLLVPLLPSFV